MAKVASDGGCRRQRCCGELVNRVMHTCQQFHGGYGYMRAFAIECMGHDAHIQSIGGSATQVMLEEVTKPM
jgi:acyl-CoA dehydrogenase